MKPFAPGPEDPSALTALAAREALAGGALRAAELTAACLRQVEAQEPRIHAWAFLDPELAGRRAAALDAWRQSGQAIGPLHGLPVGVKDIIDTADMPTENGNPLDAGRRPEADAWIVNRLRAAGAVILGKTATAECAYLAPPATRNPYDPERTPGGSSSGSAAAVASGMVPLAIGTQTGGSVIRPASYCGVVGFKPTFGRIPRTGIMPAARSLDTVGVFSRTVDDAALLADVLFGDDPGDPDTTAMAAPRLLETALTEPPVKPQFALVKTPAWSGIEPETAAGFDELREVLGDRCDLVELPPLYAEAATAHRRIMLAEMAHNLRPYYDHGAERLAEQTRAAVQDGRAIGAAEYLAALDWRAVLYSGLEEIFDRYDAIITPATAGEAPPGLASTGSAAFNVLWSLTGVPALTLPLLSGASGLPVGVQLVGRRNSDARLLRTARWLARTLADA